MRKRTRVTVASAVSLLLAGGVYFGVPAANAVLTTDENGAMPMTATQDTWWLNAPIFAGPLIPGDNATIPVKVKNASAFPARLKWGYYMSRATTAASDSFFDDVRIGWDNGDGSTIEYVPWRSTFISTPEPTAPLSQPGTEDSFVAVSSQDLQPGQVNLSTFAYAYDSATPPSPQAAGALALGLRLYKIAEPEAPVINDQPGTANDSVTAAADTDCYAYQVQYDQASGSYRVTATAANFCETSDGRKSHVWTGTLGTETPSAAVTPGQPVIVNVPGIDGDSVTLPADTTQVTYGGLTFDRNTGAWSYTAHATTGHHFVNENGQQVSEIVVSGVLPEHEVTPLMSPVITDKSGTANDSVTAPSGPDGVIYAVTHDKATGAWQLTATAAPGYKLPGDVPQMVNSGTLDIRTVIAAPAPVITDQDGTANDSVTVPEAEGVTSVITHDKATGKYEVVITAKPGYVFTDGTTQKWHTGTLSTATAPVVTPEPTPPVPSPEPSPSPAEKQAGYRSADVIDLPGFKDDQVTAPADTEQVGYKLTYDRATGKWELVVTAKDGYYLVNDKGEKVREIVLSGQLSVTGPVVTDEPSPAPSPDDSGDGGSGGSGGSGSGDDGTGKTGRIDSGDIPVAMNAAAVLAGLGLAGTGAGVWLAGILRRRKDDEQES